MAENESHTPDSPSSNDERTEEAQHESPEDLQPEILSVEESQGSKGELSTATASTTLFGLLDAIEDDNDVGNLTKLNEFLDKYSGHSEIIDALNDNLSTGLHIAAWKGLKKATESLLKTGASVSVPDSSGGYPFHIASMLGYVDIVRVLLDKDTSNIDKPYLSSGFTALNRAAYCGEKSTVELLLGYGADLTIKDSDGWTPIMSATLDGNLDIMELLINYEIDHGKKRDVSQVDIADNDERTPLMIASRNLYHQGVSLLLDAEADVNAQNNEGQTALHYALQAAEWEIVSDEGMDTTAESISKESQAVLELLLRKSTRLNIPNRTKETPLHIAARRNFAAMTMTILQRSENKGLFERDSEGQTPLTHIFSKYEVDLKKKQVSLWDDLIEYLSASEALQKIILLAVKEGSHDSAMKLFEKWDKSAGKDGWSLIEWATYKRMPAVQWLIIASSPKTQVMEESIDKAKVLVDELAKDQGKPQAQYSKSTKTTESVPLHLREKKGKPAEDNKGDLSMMTDFLNDPPFGQRYEYSTTIKPPSLDKLNRNIQEVFKDYEADIVLFRHDQDGPNRVCRKRKVREVIYDDGPQAIMEKTKRHLEHIQDLFAKIDPSSAKGKNKVESRFTWIHLPATNVSNPSTHLLERSSLKVDRMDGCKHSIDKLPGSGTSESVSTSTNQVTRIF